jgi:Golgi SNAP receptor complex protein 1
MEAADSTLTRWEGFRRDSRRLENEIELKLSEFAAFATSYSQVHLLKPQRQETVKHDQDAETLTKELEQLLLQMGDGINKIAPLVGEYDAHPQNPSALTPLLYHHKNKLQQFTTEFRKTLNHIKQTRDHAELLSSVRQDINAARRANGLNNEANYLRERGSLLSSSSISDNIIEQAYAARATLSQQQEDLKRAFGRLQWIVSSVPGLSGVMRAIVRRRLRDKIIMAVTAAVCISLILWYWFSTSTLFS